MNIGKVIGKIAGMACWAAGIVLIGLTSKAIRQSSGDIVYVVNAVFILLGGVSIGRSASSWIERRIGEEFGIKS